MTDDTPNVTRSTRAVDCQHHHHACYCREERFRKLEKENEYLRAQVELLKETLFRVKGTL